MIYFYYSGTTPPPPLIETLKPFGDAKPKQLLFFSFQVAKGKKKTGAANKKTLATGKGMKDDDMNFDDSYYNEYEDFMQEPTSNIR